MKHNVMNYNDINETYALSSIYIFSLNSLSVLYM